MPDPRRTGSRRRARAALAMLAVGSLALTGCATKHLEDYNQTPMGNAVPATSPDSGKPTQGTVVDLGGRIAAVVSLGGDTLGIQLEDPPRMVVGMVSGTRWHEVREVELPRDAGTAEPGDDVALVPFGDGVVTVHSDAASSTIAGLGTITAVAQRPTGELLTGTTDGRVVVRSPDGTQKKRLAGLTRTDQIIVGGSDIAAISRPDTTVSTVDPGADRAEPTLRVGKAVGRGSASDTGQLVLSDTTGDALLVYSMKPVILHQFFPVGPAPWAVAHDVKRSLSWVTTTGDNHVLGYDLSSGIGVRVADAPTVRQPDSLAVTASGTVAVGSHTGAGLHLLEPTVTVPTHP